MSSLEVIHAPTRSARSASRDGFETAFIARTLLLAVIAMAAAGGMLVTDSATTARLIAGAGGDWANLLRAMAALKLLFAAAATAGFCGGSARPFPRPGSAFTPSRRPLPGPGRG